MLWPLRLCDATALAAVRRSFERYGQLAALTLFVEADRLEILDGFKRVRVARALGWTTLLARVADVDAVVYQNSNARNCGRPGATSRTRAGGLSSAAHDIRRSASVPHSAGRQLDRSPAGPARAEAGAAHPLQCAAGTCINISPQ
jgi:hypothetical protein